MKILLTGVAGFIGYHVAKHLLSRGDEVVGIDNINDYYDVQLKLARLSRLNGLTGFTFKKQDLIDRKETETIFEEFRPHRVIHLAAQAGVRYSLENPHSYINSNLVGFINILEECRRHSVEHLTYASSSSVYGANAAVPYSEHQGCDHPWSLYAATKKANEVMAHSYSHLFRLPTTGLRFFTVYGPWGRPDMAIYMFTRAILEGRPINVFNNGNMRRDFTYIDDIVEGVVRVSDQAANANPLWDALNPDPATSGAPYRIFNVGNNHPIELLKLIRSIEEALGRRAEMRFMPMQAGDLLETFADVSDLSKAVDFTPATPIEVGVGRFVKWYREYHGI